MQRLRADILFWSLAWYLFVLTYGLIWFYKDIALEDIRLGDLPPLSNTISAIAIVPLFVSAYGLNLEKMIAAVKLIFNETTTLCFVCTFSVVAFFHTFYHLDGKSISYTLLLLFLVPIFSYAWYEPKKIMSMFSFLAVALTAALLLVRLIYVSPVDRYYGSIHPNLLGAIALSASICVSLSGRRALWLCHPVSLGMAVTIESRFAMLGIVFLIVAHLSLWRSRYFDRRMVLIMKIAATLLLLIVLMINATALFLVDDLDRGLSSGISGRYDVWTTALDAIGDEPWGYGFKNSYRVTSGHNGYLNIIIQLGIIVGPIIIVVFLFKAASLFLNSTFNRQRMPASPLPFGPKSEESSLVAFPSFIALLIAGVFQPQLLNFGDPQGVLFLLLFCKPSRIRPKLIHSPALLTAAPARPRHRPRGVGS